MRPRPSATTEGVLPRVEIASTMRRACSLGLPPMRTTYASMASAEPLRISRPSRFTPDMRVCAEKGVNAAARS
ncbi:MAG: hypothetical protein U0575_04335 [Phycisphaerales bacterium]